MRRWRSPGTSPLLRRGSSSTEASANGKRAGRRNRPFQSRPSRAQSKCHSSHGPNSVQTSLLVGTQAIDRLDPAYDVLQVMNKVIGGGPTGRLFITLREEKGYTYGAYSGLNAGRWRGAWQASADVRTEVTEAALRDLLAEITRMRDQPVAEKEFRDQKRAMIGSFALSLENPQQMLSYYITSWTYRLPVDYWDKYPERITAVTQAQVQAAAKKYLDPARLQIIAVGEPQKVAEILKKFGTVETLRYRRKARRRELARVASPNSRNSWDGHSVMGLGAGARSCRPAAGSWRPV